MSAFVNFRLYRIPKVVVHQIAFRNTKRPFSIRNEPPTTKDRTQEAIAEVSSQKGEQFNSNLVEY